MARKPIGDASIPGCDLTVEDVEFGRAVDQYKRRHGRPFLGFSEILAVAVSLGYRKVADPAPLPRWDQDRNRAVQVGE